MIMTFKEATRQNKDLLDTGLISEKEYIITQTILNRIQLTCHWRLQEGRFESIMNGGPMVTLNKKQTEKLELMRAFLKTEIGNEGLCLADNDITSIWFLRSIYLNATGVYLNGGRDRIEPSDITKVFLAAKKGDYDFKYFLKKEGI